MTNIEEATQNIRASIANRFIKGEGLEIGALDAPFPVGPNTKVHYVDRMCKLDLLLQYPELRPREALIIDPDIVDNGETLETIPPNSQDFIIISHFLEHTENPIGTLRTHVNRLRPEGYLIVAVPNSANPESWDAGRDLTTVEHLLKDDQEGPAWSRETHFKEWVRYAGKQTSQREIEIMAKKLMEANYSIHFHCWIFDTFKKFIICTLEQIGQNVEIVLFHENDYECFAVIQKRLQPNPHRVFSF